MKRLAFMLMILIPCFAGAQDRTRAFVDYVSGGSLTVTNSDQYAARELKHVLFTVPTAVLTNAFVISHVVLYKLPDLQTTIVTTNTQITSTSPDYIETNTHWYAQGSLETTNSFTVATTTNETGTQFYDVDDFPKGWSWEYEDKQVFSFTETNAFTLIRVYDVYQRP